MQSAGAQAEGPPPTIGGHLAICRFDHWFKNVFCIPGVVLAIFYHPEGLTAVAIVRATILGLLAAGLVASSNYVINEILDAPSDRKHQTKKFRPVPMGMVHIPLAYAQWIALMVAGLAVASIVSTPLVASLGALWVMGCIYNIPPVRSKDLTYGDVLSESINNPLRMIAGWYMITASGFPPGSLLVSYWMVGAFFMAVKRYSELREFPSAEIAGQYRRSFQFYDERKLLVSIMFYASMAMLFFGAFIMRYRLEMILSFPLVATVMAMYLNLAFRPESPVQNPEGLYREPGLMLAVAVCSAVLLTTLFVDIPILHDLLAPWTAEPRQVRALLGN